MGRADERTGLRGGRKKVDGNSGRWDGRAMNAKEAHEELDVDLECPIPLRGYAPAVDEEQETWIVKLFVRCIPFLSRIGLKHSAAQRQWRHVTSESHPQRDFRRQNSS